MIPPLAEIAQQRTVRLIPTAYWKPPVLRPLVDDEEELALLESLEGLTSRRLTAPAAPRDYDRWGSSYIQAAFTYTRRGGNRFNDEARGAWYAGFHDRTSLAEVAFHKTRELGFIGHFHDEVQYRALHASFIGRFHDIRGMTPAPACLDPDPAVGYPEGQRLAAELAAAGSRGLLYPSVRDPGGVCLVAFQENVVQDVSPGAAWTLTWSGTAEWRATPA
ncbi:RES domain-containing protein [Sphingomonas parva]|uniref:RES domain-containing protein n=1 Tax=Sphingomonas parva TaxID=2555898 RepID=A0A4Y8ZUF5_9SPHN|nr:RES family NAD+ phosphorylase [Sphingomonas parva]TFI59097.1 RES domain-containing protein [Sphingomonas parva]